jgi:hypothetical protein
VKSKREAGAQLCTCHKAMQGHTISNSYISIAAIMFCLIFFFYSVSHRKLSQATGQSRWKKLFLSCMSYGQSSRSANLAGSAKFSVPASNLRDERSDEQSLDGEKGQI